MQIGDSWAGVQARGIGYRRGGSAMLGARWPLDLNVLHLFNLSLYLRGGGFVWAQRVRGALIVVASKAPATRQDVEKVEAWTCPGLAVETSPRIVNGGGAVDLPSLQHKTMATPTQTETVPQHISKVPQGEYPVSN